MSWDTLTDRLVALGIAGFLFKVLGAIAVWIIGRRLINFAIGLAMQALRRQTVEETLLVYLASTLSVLLNIVLVLAILGFFGVETTTFAALAAGAGLAIGAAWGGLLANFAAGAFLVVLKPFKVGDFIAAGGVTGTVEELNGSVDHKAAIALLEDKLAKIPNVSATPPPTWRSWSST